MADKKQEREKNALLSKSDVINLLTVLIPPFRESTPYLAIHVWYYICINHRSSTNYRDLAHRINAYIPTNYDHLAERMPEVIRWLGDKGLRTIKGKNGTERTLSPHKSYGYDVSNVDPLVFFLECTTGKTSI